MPGWRGWGRLPGSTAPSAVYALARAFQFDQRLSWIADRRYCCPRQPGLYYGELCGQHSTGHCHPGICAADIWLPTEGPTPTGHRYAGYGPGCWHQNYVSAILC